MRARPAWVRKLWVAVGLGAAFALAFGGYWWARLTADVSLAGFARVNPADASEAERKLGIYRKALQASERGFVRLSLSEINSYLNERLEQAAQEDGADQTARSPELLESAAAIAGKQLVWYCRLRKRYLGRQFEFDWLRWFEIDPTVQGWDLSLVSMAVGKVEIPPEYRAVVQNQFGAVDEVLAEQRQWLSRVPASELSTNSLTGDPELRLFTYRYSETTKGPKR